MKLDTAANLPGEVDLLDRVVSDLTDTDALGIYADFLWSSGDAVRSDFLRSYIAAYRALDYGLLPVFGEVPPTWARLVGATMFRSMLDEVKEAPGRYRELFDRILRLALPALSLTYDEADGRFSGRTAYRPSLGETSLFGHPDLPDGLAWPTFSECLTFGVDNWDFPGDDPCRFIGQLNLADLTGTVIGSRLPPAGLISLFANLELEQWGTFSVCVKHVAGTAVLRRGEAPPNLREDNEPLSAREVLLTEQLSLPDGEDSPCWGKVLGLADYGERASRIYRRAGTSCGDTSLGFFGYLHGTTGSDPTPDPDHLRFASIRVSHDAGIAHLAIHKDDLPRMRLEALKYVWLDWDS